MRDMKYLPCSCSVCSNTSVKSLLELEHPERTRLLAVHNLNVLKEELEACKEAIAEGRLWDLVEERSMAHPRLREAFLELSRYSDDLAAGTPAMKERGLFVRSAIDLLRPEVLTAQKRLAQASAKRATTAVLISGRGSPNDSGAMPGRDVYLPHPVFGPVPAELRFQYPFSQTEVGTFVPAITEDESKRRLRSSGYRAVGVGSKGTPKKRVKNRRTRRGASPSPP